MHTVTDEQKYDGILFVGDIHGTFHVISDFIIKHKLKNMCFIQVGDFGVFNMGSQRPLFKLNKALYKYNCVVYAMRGNHDNPDYFNGIDRFQLNNVRFVKDYTTLVINSNNENKRIFLVGGAVSIDRMTRHLNVSYWTREVFDYDPEIYDLSTIKDIEIVVTHTRPSYFPPFVSHDIVFEYADRDYHLLPDLENEKKRMDMFFNDMQKYSGNTLNKWFYGHFHFSSKCEYNNVLGVLLAIDEFYFI